MRHITALVFITLLSGTAQAAAATASTNTYAANAYFTSGIVDGEAIDRIDSAQLDQDYIVLYVDWDSLKIRAYHTEVWIVDPNGDVVGKVSNILRPRYSRYSTYYYYRPNSEDPPGDWTYQVYVDGRNAFEARIPVMPAE